MTSRATPGPTAGLPSAATLPTGLVGLLAAASGMSVANVYYAQPLLDALATAFAIPQAAVGGVVTATQLGCALALLLLVPLGDRMERRRLMLLQCLLLVAALVGVALARGPLSLLAGMLAVGMLGTAMTQGLIAYAANAATPAEQGRVVGATQGGVFVGLLLARVFSGAVSDTWGWRGVYASAALLMLGVGMLLHRRLPAQPQPAQALPYLRLLGTMGQLLRHDRTLQVRGTLALLMFAAFNVFWSALVLPLSAAPFNYSHTQIGAFGLVGAVGALAAARAGRWVDRGKARAVTLLALSLLVLAWWPLSWLPVSLWMLVLGIVLLDMGGQALHVTNQSLILRHQAQASGRLVGLYMLFYALGSGMGAIASTAIHARHGWSGVCALGAAISVVALLFGVLTGGACTDAQKKTMTRREPGHGNKVYRPQGRGRLTSPR